MRRSQDWRTGQSPGPNNGGLAIATKASEKVLLRTGTSWLMVCVKRGSTSALAALAASLILSSSADAAPKAGEVALTFDDLPALTILPDQRYVDYLNAAILWNLRRNQVPAIGFVNEGKIDDLEKDHQIANLERWLDAGMELGNHTYSHPSLNEMGASAYIEDIARGEKITKELLASHKEQMRYFRPPYLETGKTLETKNKVLNWLRTHGYQLAPVTIDADDWEFAEPYDDAIARRDKAAQRRIKAQYLSFTSSRVAWAKTSARLLFGRDIAQIMLLHCTRLNADALNGVLKILRRAHLKPVSLQAALQDPVYRQPDKYIGPDGIDWLERWADARGKDLPDAGNEDPPRDIQAAYDRVDNDRH